MDLIEMAKKMIVRWGAEAVLAGDIEVVPSWKFLLSEFLA